MALFPETMPRPEPDMDDAPFWEACARKQLRFQSCAVCGMLRHPPAPICSGCHSTEVVWSPAPAEAEVFSFTVIHHASHAAVADNLPYVVGLVTFPGLPGVKLVTNITDIPLSEVRIGMPLSLWWDDIGDGMHLPRFRPA